MRLDRESFEDSFTLYNIPNWDCSTCKKGKLLFDAKNISVYETYSSRVNRSHDAWEADWIIKHFNGKIVCNNPKCKEIFSIAGYIKVEVDYEENENSSFTECYYPQYIFPLLHIFCIPEDTPKDVEKAIHLAFKVFWIDKSACANAIRTTVEVILNDKKVLKSAITKGKKRRSLSLHERIELYEKKNCEVAKYLMAIKWIGNAGSHEGELTSDDILDGLDLLKYALEKLYTMHDKEIAQITKKINKRKKPLT